MIGEITFCLQNDDAVDGFNEFLFSKQNNLQGSDFELIQHLLSKSDIIKTTELLFNKSDQIRKVLQKVKNYIQSVCDTVSENMLMNGKLVWKVFYLDLMTLYVYYFKQYLILGLKGALNLCDNQVCESVSQEFFEVLQTTQRVEVVSSNKIRKTIHNLLYQSEVRIGQTQFSIFESFLDMSLLLATSPLHINYFIDSIDFQMFDDGEYSQNISKGSLIHKFAKFWLLELNEIKEKISLKFKEDVTEQFYENLNVLQFAQQVFQVDTLILLQTILKDEDNKSLIALTLVYKWKLLMNHHYWISRIQDINSLYLIKFEFDFEGAYNYYIKRIQQRVFKTLETPLVDQVNDFQNFRLWIKCLVDSVYFKLKTDTDYINSSSYQVFENNYLEILDDLIFYIKNDFKNHKFQITKLIYDDQLTFIRFIVLLSDCEHAFQNLLSKVLKNPSVNNHVLAQEAAYKLERLRENHLILLQILISKVITIPIKSIQYFGLLNFNKEELTTINEYLLSYVQNIIDQTPLPIVVYGGQKRHLTISESYVIFKSLFNQLDEKTFKEFAINIGNQILQKFQNLMDVCSNNYEVSFAVCRLIKKVFRLTEQDTVQQKYQLIVLEIIPFFLRNNFSIPNIFNNTLVGMLQQTDQATNNPNFLFQVKQLFLLTQINTKYIYLEFHKFPPFTLDDFKQAYDVYFNYRIDEKINMQKLFMSSQQYDSNLFSTYFRIRQSKYQMEIGIMEKMILKVNSKLMESVKVQDYNDFIMEMKYRLCDLSFFSRQAKKFTKNNHHLPLISREKMIQDLRQFFITASFSQIKLVLNVSFQDQYFMNHEVANQLKELKEVLNQISLLKMIWNNITLKEFQSQKGDLTEKCFMLIEFIEKFYHDDESIKPLEFNIFIRNQDENQLVQLCKNNSIRILIALCNEMASPDITQYTLLQMMHFLANFFNQYFYSRSQKDETSVFKQKNPGIIEYLELNVNLIQINSVNLAFFVQNTMNLIDQFRYYQDDDIFILKNQNISTRFIFLQIIYFLMNVLNIIQILNPDQDQDTWNTLVSNIQEYFYSILRQNQQLIIKAFTLNIDLSLIIGPYKLYTLENSLIQILKQDEQTTVKIIPKDQDLLDLVLKIIQEKNIFNNLYKFSNIKPKFTYQQNMKGQKIVSNLLKDINLDNHTLQFSYFDLIKIIYNEFKFDQNILKEELQMIEQLKTNEAFQQFQVTQEQKIEKDDKNDMDEWEDEDEVDDEDEGQGKSKDGESFHQSENEQSLKKDQTQKSSHQEQQQVKDKESDADNWEEEIQSRQSSDDSSLSHSTDKQIIDLENKEATKMELIKQEQCSSSSSGPVSSSEINVNSDDSSKNEKYRAYLDQCMPLYEVREKQAVAFFFKNQIQIQEYDKEFQKKLQDLKRKKLIHLVFLDDIAYELTKIEKPNLYSQIKNLQDIYLFCNISSVNPNIISSSEDEEDDESQESASSGLQGSEGDYADVELKSVSIEELDVDEDRYPTFGTEVEEKSFISEQDSEIQPLRTIFSQIEKESTVEKTIPLDQIQYPTRLFLLREQDGQTDLIDLTLDIETLTNEFLVHDSTEKKIESKKKKINPQSGKKTKKQKKNQKEVHQNEHINSKINLDQELHYFLIDKFYWTEAERKCIKASQEYQTREKAIQKYFLRPNCITIQSVQIIFQNLEQLLKISKVIQLNNIQQTHIKDVCFFFTFLFHKNKKCRDNFKKRILNLKQSQDLVIQSILIVVLQSLIQWGDYMQDDYKFTLQFALELLKEVKINEQILGLVIQFFIIPDQETIQKQKIIKILNLKFIKQPQLENIFINIIIDQYDNLIQSTYNILDNLIKMKDVSQDKKLIYCQLALDEPISFQDINDEILLYFINKLWKMIRSMQSKLEITPRFIEFNKKLLAIFQFCEILFSNIKTRNHQYYESNSIECKIENISRTLKKLFRCLAKLIYQVLPYGSLSEMIQIEDSQETLLQIVREKTKGIETAMSNMINLDEHFIKLYIAFFLKTNSENLQCTSVQLRLEFCWQSIQDILLEKDQHEDEIQNIVHRGKEFQAWSYHLMRHQIIEVLGRDFNTTFEDENGADQGGLTQDFITHFVKLVMDPRRGLFRYTPLHHKAFISNSCHLIPDNLTLYATFGLFISKFQINDYTLAVNLTNFTIKFLFDDQRLTMQDMIEYDPELANHLNWILQNDISDLGMTFEISDNSLGQHSTIEIIPNGININVTNENKQKYVDAYIKYKLYDQVKEQIEAFKLGFVSGFPKIFHQIFSIDEFQLMLGHQAAIDIEKLKKHTTFQDINEDSEIINWYWEILEEMTQDQLSQLLYFITASYQIPVGGYEQLGITVYYQGQKNQLPVSHTCSNQLGIFEYQSKQEFKEKLYMAMMEGNGFGFA